MQRGKEKIPAAIAGEDPAGAIAAVRGGSEADDPKPCIRIAEARHRLAPVIPVGEGASLRLRDLAAVRAQALAAIAGNHLLVQLPQ